MPIKQLLKQKR